MFQPRKILLPLDVEMGEFEAVPFVIDLAKQFGAELHFFFVNSPQASYRHPALSVEDLKQRVETHESAAELATLPVEYAVTRGDLGEHTLEYCHENAIDLIVTMHRHHSRLFYHLLDTRDENIIDSVDVPVLVLPRERLAHSED